MQNHYTNALAAKVAAQNEANKAAIELYAKAVEPLKAFVGQKILKVDGTLLEKVRKALPELVNTNEFRAYYTDGHGYSLCIAITVNKSSPSRRGDCLISQHMGASAYLAELRNGVLVKLYNVPQLRTDFSDLEILLARKDLEYAKKAMSVAQGRLYSFGEYDA